MKPGGDLDVLVKAAQATFAAFKPQLEAQRLQPRQTAALWLLEAALEPFQSSGVGPVDPPPAVRAIQPAAAGRFGAGDGGSWE